MIAHRIELNLRLKPAKQILETGRFPMKNFCRLATLALALCVIATTAVAQAPATALSNLVEGVGPMAGGNTNWANYSELVLIPGPALLGVKSSSTALYIGFYGGSTVDIGNMVLYGTSRNGTTILSTKKVTLGGIANPSINLTSTSVCPVQPVSITNPCIIKLDPVKGALSSLDDYYFAMYFTNDANNQTVLSIGNMYSQGSLSGYNVVGDETRIKKKGSLPPGYNGGAPYFLMYVANE
jgi:hypothetical protein